MRVGTEEMFCTDTLSRDRELGTHSHSLQLNFTSSSLFQAYVAYHSVFSPEPSSFQHP